MIVALLAMLALLFAPSSKAWPSADQGGHYYVVKVDPSKAPTPDGKLAKDEWSTQEEYFKDTYGSLTYNEGPETGISISLVMLTDGQFLYVKVTWENTVTDGSSPNSIGLAFANTKISGMSSTYDRKVSYFDGSSMNSTDLFNCDNSPSTVNITTFCAGSHFRPGVPDTEPADFQSAFGFDGKPFHEFKIPLNPTNVTEDLPISIGGDNPTYMKIVVNPFNNIAHPDEGHAGIGSDIIKLEDVKRCFFCQPEGPMDGNAKVFNTFFALVISGIFLSFLVSARSESIAKKLWKVDVSEDMAKHSVIMEMAYYNSSFLSLLVTVFFGLYSLIGFLYGFWANWGMTGAIINGIPLVLGILTAVDLVMRNQNPQEMEYRPGTDVSEAGKFWLVPTLFLATTLLMLVFIGIDVIA